MEFSDTPHKREGKRGGGREGGREGGGVDETEIRVCLFGSPSFCRLLLPFAV